MHEAAGALGVAQDRHASRAARDHDRGTSGHGGNGSGGARATLVIAAIDAGRLRRFERIGRDHRRSGVAPKVARLRIDDHDRPRRPCRPQRRGDRFLRQHPFRVVAENESIRLLGGRLDPLPQILRNRGSDEMRGFLIDAKKLLALRDEAGLERGSPFRIDRKRNGEAVIARRRGE